MSTPDPSDVSRSEAQKDEQREIKRIRKFWNKPPNPTFCSDCKKEITLQRGPAPGMFSTMPCEHCGSNAGWTSTFTTGGRDAKEDINFLLASLAPSPVPARQEAKSLNPLLIEHTTLRRELRNYLDTLTITGETIGDLRRSLFMPWASEWNGWVRDETASRETSAALAPAPAILENEHAHSPQDEHESEPSVLGTGRTDREGSGTDARLDARLSLQAIAAALAPLQNLKPCKTNLAGEISDAIERVVARDSPAPAEPPTDALDLEPIKAREAAATKGPWKIRSSEAEDGETDWWVVYPNGEDTSVLEARDAEFIAHARQDIPALLAEVARRPRCRATGRAKDRQGAAVSKRVNRIHAKVPRFLETAIRKGLKIAGSVGVEEADDRSWLTITFKKLPIPAAQDITAGELQNAEMPTDPRTRGRRGNA